MNQVALSSLTPPALQAPVRTKDAATRILAAEVEAAGGWIRPVTVCRSGGKLWLVDGNRRAKVARDRGMTHIPCVEEALPPGKTVDEYFYMLNAGTRKQSGVDYGQMWAQTDDDTLVKFVPSTIALQIRCLLSITSRARTRELFLKHEKSPAIVRWVLRVHRLLGLEFDNNGPSKRSILEWLVKHGESELFRASVIGDRAALKRLRAAIVADEPLVAGPALKRKVAETKAKRRVTA